MAEVVGLASCAEVPVESDEGPLHVAFERAGRPCEVAVWDDLGVDWSRFAAVLIRTTWDYTDRVEAFRAWADRVGEATRLWNPPEVVRWNSHKGYLLDLGARGVAVVPTTLVEAGADPAAALVVARDRGWVRIVVKPAVGVGAIGAGVWDAGDPGAALAAQDHLRAGNDVLVQPFVDSIATAGETSVILIDGTCTHAVRKIPRTGDFRSQPEHGGALAAVEPTAAQLALASDAVAAACDAVGVSGDGILYARVDCIDVGGAPHLMELELIEPDLYFGHGATCAPALVSALAGRLR